jgi:site-specific DNA recombinase
MLNHGKRAEEDGVKRVGIWIRVSTEDQAKGESPEHHEKRARSYADAKGWNVREVYNLAGVSGKAVMHHPEAQRMLKDIQSGHIQGLIFSKLARLARNTKELLDFADRFRSCNADLISLQESIDTSTPAGRLFYTMIAAMAQWEREEIAERVAVSIPIRAKLGKPIGGSPPFGYHWKDKKLLPHPAEGPIRKQIYELFAECNRYKRVARVLNDAGHRTRNGKKFTDTDIKRFIQDTTAKGIHRCNYTTRVNGKAAVKAEKDWVLNAVEPLVSEELWNRCNSLIADRKTGPRPIGKKPVHLFAGTAFCVCGNKMYVPSNTPKYVCQKCRNKIPIVDLEGVFHEQLKNFFLSPEEVAKYLNEADKTLQHKQEVLDILIQEKQRVAQAMDRVYQLYIDGQISAEGFGTRYKPLEERLNQLDEEIPRLQAEVDLLKISYLSKDQMLTNARDLYARWPTLDHEEKRKVAESLTQRITVGKGEIDIDLCYLPSSESMAKGQQTDRFVATPRVSFGVLFVAKR